MMIFAQVMAVIYSIVNPVPGADHTIFAIVVILISLLVLIYFYWLQKRGVLR